MDRQNSTIGRDTIPNSDINDIARNELFSANPGNMTVTNDLSFVCGVLIERSNRLLGTAFLRDTNNRVQDKDSENLREGSLAQSPRMETRKKRGGRWSTHHCRINKRGHPLAILKNSQGE